MIARYHVLKTRANWVASTSFERRLLNQTFFERILVGEEGVEGAEMTPVYAAVAAWEPRLGAPRHLSRPKEPASTARATKKNPNPAFRGQGSHKAKLVDVIWRLSSPTGPLKTLLDNTRWYAKDATELIPPPDQLQRPIGEQHRQMGWVLAAVEQVLQVHDGPMRAKAVHGAVEARLGRRVSWSSVKGALADHASGPAARFVRVARGTYRLAS
jgi:hypothetical protein